MMKLALQLARARHGATAAEFALVLPLLLILLFGIIDGGRFMWEYNRAEKATQVGARMAIVTDIVSTGLRDNNYVGVSVGGATLSGGNTIPAAALGKITCTNTACTCTGACTGIGNGRNAAAFTNLVNRMRQIKPDITADDVSIIYRGSGLGFAGDPTGMSMSPLVTVEVSGLEFQPLTSLMLASIDLPTFAATLTAEDSVGSASN